MNPYESPLSPNPKTESGLVSRLGRGLASAAAYGAMGVAIPCLVLALKCMPDSLGLFATELTLVAPIVLAFGAYFGMAAFATWTPKKQHRFLVTLAVVAVCSIPLSIGLINALQYTTPPRHHTLTEAFNVKLIAIIVAPAAVVALVTTGARELSSKRLR